MFINFFQFEFRGKALACSSALLEQIGSKDMMKAVSKEGNRLKCFQRCEHQTENPILTTSGFPVESTFPSNPIFCLTLNKVSRICNSSVKAKVFESSINQTGINCKEIMNANNTNKICLNDGTPNATSVHANPKMTDFLFQYAKQNLAVVKVLIRDPFYTLIKRDEQSPLISSIGNTGGLLGLCMGISLVSVFEIFFHCFNNLLSKCTKMCK
jgi:hypothetical protein